ncbi:MAG: hypothetical protein LC737_02500 [Chloroflexi bacterium]|nr:hypothetical protein [Chloroflexota bacterium]
MNSNVLATYGKANVEDVAVDGLLAGFGAGVLMALYLVGASLLSGDNLLTLLGRFDSIGQTSPAVGVLTHLAVSGIYGIVFALVVRFVLRARRFPSWLVGVLYGLLLFGIAQAVILPRAAVALQDIPMLNFAIAHLIYGLALGLLLARYRAAWSKSS